MNFREESSVMLTIERRQLIIDKLRLEGRVVAKLLAGELGLSEDTIRKDLREMAAEGLLMRVHGGALPVTPDLPDFSARASVSTQEKHVIGKRAAALIAPGQMIFIDGGTTNAELTRALPRHFEFKVVTHSPTIAAELEHFPNIDVLLIGGTLYRHSMVAVGSEAYQAISRIRPNIFFMGVTGAHPHHGFSTGDHEEANIKRAIASQAKETWVLLTVSKIDVVSPVTIIPFSAAKGVVVEKHPPMPWVSILNSAGVEILTTEDAVG